MQKRKLHTLILAKDALYLRRKAEITYNYQDTLRREQRADPKEDKRSNSTKGKIEACTEEVNKIGQVLAGAISQTSIVLSVFLYGVFMLL